MANQVKIPTYDKIFREVKQDGVFALSPSSNAIGIVLRISLTKKPCSRLECEMIISTNLALFSSNTSHHYFMLFDSD